jgi:hypothetical protein
VLAAWRRISLLFRMAGRTKGWAARRSWMRYPPDSILTSHPPTRSRAALHRPSPEYDALGSMKRAGFERKRLGAGGRAHEPHRLHGEVGGAIAPGLRDRSRKSRLRDSGRARDL